VKRYIRYEFSEPPRKNVTAYASTQNLDKPINNQVALSRREWQVKAVIRGTSNASLNAMVAPLSIEAHGCFDGKYQVACFPGSFAWRFCGQSCVLQNIIIVGHAVFSIFLVMKIVATTGSPFTASL